LTYLQAGHQSSLATGAAGVARQVRICFVFVFRIECAWMRNVARDRRSMCVGCFDQNLQIFQTPTRREFCICLKEAQFDIFKLKAAGFSVGDLKSEFDLASLKSEFDLVSLKSEFDLASLKSEFDLASLKSAGFDFSALVSAGFSAAELTAVGFASEVKVCL
jgi:hypothetical protein